MWYTFRFAVCRPSFSASGVHVATLSLPPQLLPSLPSYDVADEAEEKAPPFVSLPSLDDDDVDPPGLLLPVVENSPPAMVQVRMESLPIDGIVSNRMKAYQKDGEDSKAVEPQDAIDSSAPLQRLRPSPIAAPPSYDGGVEPRVHASVSPGLPNVPIASPAQPPTVAATPGVVTASPVQVHRSVSQAGRSHAHEHGR